MTAFLTDQGTPQAIFEAYSELRWNRWLHKQSTVRMTINRHVNGATRLIDALGMELGVLDGPGATRPDLAFEIEQVTPELDQGGRETENILVRGVEVGRFHKRICLPPPFNTPLSDTDSHHVIDGPAETAMRDIVRLNVGPDAPATRRLDVLSVDADQGRGPEREWAARFQTIAERLEAWSLVSQLGWEVRFEPPDFIFGVIPETDRSAAVVFDVAFDNVLAQRWYRSHADLYTLAYVAGQGEGTDREVVKAWLGDDEPTGRDRRELFVDARDLADTDALVERGREELAKQSAEDVFELEVSPLASKRYRTDWDLGDVVTLRSTDWGLERTSRIAGVESVVRVDTGYVERHLTFGKALPTIRDRVLQEVGARGSARR